MTRIRTSTISLLVTAVLAGCGGGSSNPGTTTAAPPPVITLAAPVTVSTLAGGKPIALSASTDNGAALGWQLPAGAPGSLSASTGASVNYQPPAGSLSSPTSVAVTVSAGTSSKSLTLALAPDPGVAGISRIADAASLHGGVPTMYVPRYVAGDGNGNIYIGEHLGNVSPTRQSELVVSKIGRNGSLSKVYESSAQGILRYTRGMAVDRAGNVYVIASSFPFNAQAGVQWDGVAVYKIGADGIPTILAGDLVTQTGAIIDGQGKAARFLTPWMAGIDPDGNLYINDADAKVRKVTPQGLVSTITALPAWLGADMNGNRYVANAEQNTITRLGSAAVVAGTPGCGTIGSGPLSSCIGAPRELTQLDAVTYAFLSYDPNVGTAVMKMVVPR